MVDIGIPNNAANFYSMLSGLGDQIAANRKQAQVQSALDAANQPGVSYGDAIRGLVSAGALPQAQIFATQQAHQDAIAAQTRSEAHQAAQDAERRREFEMNYGLSKRTADRRDQTPLEQAQEREAVASKYGIDPASPEGRTFIATGALPEPKKPIPFETLGGTKFLVPQPGGGYGSVDPSSLAPAGGARPPMAVPEATPPNPGAMPSLNPAPPVAAAGGGPAPVVAPQGNPPTPAGPPLVAPNGQPPQPPVAPAADLEAIDPATGRREAWLKAQSPDVQAYIKKIADYEVDPRTTSIKGGHREQVMSAVARYDPTYDQNTFSSRSKAIRDFSTGQQGNAIRSFDVATDHLDTLQKYSDALKNGDVRLINSIRNAWLTQTGSQLPTNIQAVAPIVGAEVSKAIIGSNNALADREELRKPLNSANSPEQLSGAIQAYKALMAGQLKGLKKQYEDTTGKKDFNNRIRESTKNVLMREDAPALSGVPAAAVDYLKKNPTAAADFDKKYGDGSSKAILGE